MPQATSSSSSADGANIELGATLLFTNTKYTRIWRRSLYIGFLISLKKPTTSTSNIHDSSLPLLSSLPPATTSSSKSSIAIDIEEEQQQQERIRSDIARIVKEKNLKSLYELGGVDSVAVLLARQRQRPRPRQHPPQGDTIDDGNTTIPLPVLGINLSKFVLNSYKCYRCTIWMLLVSAGLSFAIEFKKEGPKHGWHDGVAIVLAVLLLVLGKSIANFLRERKTLKLAKRKNELELKVKTGEEFPMVPISDIVLGDTVCLWPGDEVPADGLLVSDGILVVADEAIKSKHDPKGDPFLISGSKVIGGHGRMVVVASVGNKTNLAEIGTSNADRNGLLESLIEKPISYIDIATLFISVLVALVVFIRLTCGKDGNNDGLPEMKGNISISLLMETLQRVLLRPQGRVSILSGLVTVAILCVQHGMPLVVTISLKYQIDKVVSNKDAVLNDLSACTTMGLVTVICIDASGGLISTPMEVSSIWMGEKDVRNVEESETNKLVLDKLQQGVGLSVLAPETSLSPLSNLLVSWAETEWKMNMRSFTENFDILKHSKLNSGKEGNGVLVRKIGDNEVLHLHWSGAASTILEMCSQYYDSKGNCNAMENQKIKFGQVIKKMEDDGLKPIAFAYRPTNREELEQEELILLAVLGLEYTSQETIKSALENLRNAANIQIKLVSEDGIMEVKGIACELGLENDTELEGKELRDLKGKARLDKVDQAHVMASFHPKDKLLMIQCLQEKGKVVAFIGTRLMTNHTSVLKVADVGIVLDSVSRIVDRDSSDITIKCFSVLEAIVMAGRSQYHNIQKFIQLQLTCTISGSVVTLITACTGDSPLSASQLIWVNVLMCILGGLMMIMKLTSEEQRAKQPCDHRNQHIITKESWKGIVIQVLYQASVSMILEFGGHATQREKKVRETMIFNTFLLCQVFNMLNTMQLLRKEVLNVVVQIFYFMGALGGCFLMQVLVIEYAKCLADCMQLNATRWGICVLIGALAWAIEWTLKNIFPVILNPRTDIASESITSPSFYLSRPFAVVMFFFFPAGLIFSQIGTNMTIR